MVKSILEAASPKVPLIFRPQAQRLPSAATAAQCLVPALTVDQRCALIEDGDNRASPAML